MVGRRAALSTSSEAAAALMLRGIEGLGDVTVSRIIAEAGSARAALAAPEMTHHALRKRRRPIPMAALLDRESLEGAEARVKACTSRGIRIVTFGAPSYPHALLSLFDPPTILYARGSLELLRRPAVAIVGARKATASGRRTAERLARDLSRRGITVVSGMALGIDGAAHRGALNGKGGTIAVLGRGPERAYPVAQGALFRAVAEQGLLLSEFPPGTRVRPHNFPRRNRILAALSRGVVVVEAGERSGSLNTSSHAQGMGRDVMAVPGCVEWDQCVGTNQLILEGSDPVISADDVVRNLVWGRHRPGTSQTELLLQPRITDREQGADEQVALDHLTNRPRGIETLLGRSGLPAPRLLVALTRLELDGVVLRDAEGWRRSP